MGCHTWVYKKYRQCTKERKEAFLKELNERLKYLMTPFDEFAKNRKECSEDYKKIFPKDSEEYRMWEEYAKDENIAKDYNKRITKFEAFREGINDDNVMEFCKLDSDSSKYRIINNILYIYTDFDYPFRVYGYPEDEFTNKEELLTWLQTLKSNYFGYYDDKYEFHEGYTKELVERINQYFEENGEDNLFIEFG